VDIRAALEGVSSYSHTFGKQQPAQRHLWSIVKEPPPELPIGLRLRVSGSGQSLPIVPWIALLDPDVTTTATDGLYIVYLYTSGIDAVYLSMNQGATQHRLTAEQDGKRGRAAELTALAEIAGETAALRELAGSSLLADTLEVIELGAPRFLPTAYEAGNNIAALRYEMSALPTAAKLTADLSRFSALYARCVEAKDQLAANRRVRTSSRSTKRQGVTRPPTPVFKPKDSSDYLARVDAATQRRGRRHEALVQAFGETVLETGRAAATNVHPRDLIVQDGELEWLVEAKIVGVNAELGVRAAIGQLFAYRHFYYRETNVSDPQLLALFDAPVGEAFEGLLSSLGIFCLYRSGREWRGSPEAVALVT
jgi:MrcB-like, N-terminal domain